MLGAIIGDMIGSAYEFNNVKRKDFPLWTADSRLTDDTVCTIAIADALLNHKPFDKALRDWCRRYPEAGYGPMFQKWIESDTMPAYKSWGNGAVMRLSPVAFLSADKTEALLTGMEQTAVTHNSAEAISATKAYLEAFFDLKEEHKPNYIAQALSDRYGYQMDRSVDFIRASYNKFYVRCSKTVPEAIICALEATDFEDAIRNAISLGGDSDTLAAMAGALAEVRFGIPGILKTEVLSRLDNSMKKILTQMYQHPNCVKRKHLSYHPLTGEKER